MAGMNRYFGLILLLFSQSIPFVLCDFYTPSSGVINLDNTNFDQMVGGANEDDVSIIEFYAPWCGHCKNLKPEYVKLAKAVKGLVNVFALDANEENNKGLAQRFGVQGFPTLKVIIGNNPPEDYRGERTSKAMKQFLLSKLPSYVTKLSEKSLDKFLTTNADSEARAIVLSKKSTASPTLKRLSALVKGNIKIGEIGKSHSKAVAKKFDVSLTDGSVLLVFPKGETENPTMFSGNTKSFREIQTFLYGFAPGLEIDEDQLPKLLDESCYQERCVKKGLCVILLTGEDEEDNKKVQNVVREVQDTKDDSSLFAFSQMDGLANAEWISTVFGGDVNTMYANVVVLAPIKKRYALYVGSFTTEAVGAFVSGILRGGTRTAAISSPEIPSLSTETEICKPKPKPKPKPQSKPYEQQPGQSSKDYGSKDWKHAAPGGGSNHILTLTPKNFQTHILNSNQPAIVEFYAPWCGHCKNLAPEFAKAANQLKGMVLFGGVDCNEDSNRPICSRYQVQGFPTLKVFPVGVEGKEKRGAQDYQGARTAKAIEKEALSTLYSVKIPTLVNIDDFNAFMSDMSSEAKLLLFTEKNKPPTMLRALAAKFDSVAFAMVSSKQNQLIEGLGVKSLPSIYGYTSMSSAEEAIVFGGETTFVELNKFVTQLVDDKVDDKYRKKEL